ncbi:MAG: hypothetical protein AAB403_14730 [Planctomycetota bacterium]
MKQLCKTLLLIALPALIFGGTLTAEERGRVREMRGTFIRLVEQQVNEQGYLGVVIKPFESDDHVTVLVPRENEDLRVAARQLQEGQTLGIAFASEGQNNWVTRMEAGRPRDRADESAEGQKRIMPRGEIRREPGEFVQRPEGERRPAEGDVRRDPGQVQESPEARRDRAVRSAEERERLRPSLQREGARPAPGPEPMEAQIRGIVARHAEQMGRAVREAVGAHLQRMQAEIRELRAHAERMEREMQELRAENERLRMQLRNRGEPGIEREREIRERAEPQRRRESRPAQEGEPPRDREPRREPAPSPQ